MLALTVAASLGWPRLESVSPVALRDGANILPAFAPDGR